MRYNLGMRSPVVLSAILVAALSVPAQELPPFELPADVAARVQALTGDEPLQLLAALGGMDLERRRVAGEQWQQLDHRARCALTRAGLRSLDPAVLVGAAVESAHNAWWLDLAETKRAARAGMARCNVVDTPFDVADYFGLLDAEDTALLLANPGPQPHEIPQFIGPLHHRLGPEHATQLELLAHGDDVLLRPGAAAYLGVVNPHRLRYGWFLLSRPIAPPVLPDDFDAMVDRMPYEPRKVALRPKGAGYDPVLAALLEDLCLSGREFESGPLDFAWRWARAQTAGAIDRDLLLRLARGESDEGRRVAVRGLAQLEDGADARAALQVCAEADRGRGVAPFFALAELCRRGDGAAGERLAAWALEQPLALASLWQVDRARALPFVDEALRAGAAMHRLEQVLGAVEDGEFWGLPMAEFTAELVRRAEPAQLDGRRLAALLANVPAARTGRLLRQAIAALDAGCVELMPLGVLELGDAAALAIRLRGILDDEQLPRDAFGVALHAAMRLDAERLGDDAAVQRLWDRCEIFGLPRERARARLRLASVRGDAVRARALAGLERTLTLDKDQRPGAIAPAVAACGVDHRLADSLLYTLESNAEPAEVEAAYRVMLPALRDGDGIGAIAGLLAADLFGVIHLEVWTLPDAIALPVLQRAIGVRERGEYRYAIGQLMRRGDSAARDEVERAIEARLYGWIDTFERDVLTDGKSLDRVPLLLSQVDSNCCTFAVIASALEEIFEVSAFVGESGAMTRPQRLHLAWQRHREDLHWSRIAERWLILP